jgi:hypothetical protein
VHCSITIDWSPVRSKLSIQLILSESPSSLKYSPVTTTDFGQLVFVDLDVGKPVTRTAFGFTLCREESKLEILNNAQEDKATMHTGRLTASILQEVSNTMEVIVKHKITKPTPFIGKVLGKSQSIDHVPAIKYGRATENTARNLFFDLESQKHRNLKVEQCGLFVKSNRLYIAGSPDGIVSYNCCPTAVLEIKYPYTLVDKSVKDVLYTIARANGSDRSKNGTFLYVVFTNHCQL